MGGRGWAWVGLRVGLRVGLCVWGGEDVIGPLLVFYHLFIMHPFILRPTSSHLIRRS